MTLSWPPGGSGSGGEGRDTVGGNDESLEYESSPVLRSRPRDTMIWGWVGLGMFAICPASARFFTRGPVQFGSSARLELEPRDAQKENDPERERRGEYARHPITRLLSIPARNRCLDGGLRGALPAWQAHRPNLAGGTADATTPPPAGDGGNYSCTTYLKMQFRALTSTAS